MSGTSLVHPRTAHLPPDEQAKGNYVYTSPEELSRLETLKSAEMQRLSGVNTEPTVTGRISAEMPAIPQALSTPVRVVRRHKAHGMLEMDYAALECRMAAHILGRDMGGVFSRMSASVKESIFVKLADDLGYNIE